MAAAQSYDLSIDRIGSGWIIATFVKRTQRFRVIDGNAPVDAACGQPVDKPR
jgi:hypothetical protein